MTGLKKAIRWGTSAVLFPLFALIVGVDLWHLGAKILGRTDETWAETLVPVAMIALFAGYVWATGKSGPERVTDLTSLRPGEMVRITRGTGDGTSVSYVQRVTEVGPSWIETTGGFPATWSRHVTVGAIQVERVK